ncbi:C40 family peptidase [Pseudonocardia phyllosphaerae]|uniref:C40 family peptidase n=1 Tax=Pseudonocardia phyllosphaerae TaxID=3390502 RepID=UPI00397CA443
MLRTVIRRSAVSIGVLALLGTLSPAASAAPTAPTAGPPTEYVSVAVATVWTEPTSPRPVDKPALENPVRSDDWLRDMTLADEENLTNDGLTQTQAVYGAPVRVLEKKGDWSRVAVENQPNADEPLGYPGWIPSRQLTTDAPFQANLHRGPLAVVTAAPRAWLYADPDLTKRRIQIPYNTKLPVLGQRGKTVQVLTPGDRPAWLRAADVDVRKPDQKLPTPTGAQLVAEGKKFLGVDYVWAGRSGFAFDCSGYTGTLYEAAGILLPRDSGPQANSPLARPVDKKDLKPGDLIFYAHDGGKGKIHHVGMYAGDGKMLEAKNAGIPVRLTPARLDPARDGYWGARRYLPGNG